MSNQEQIEHVSEELSAYLNGELNASDSQRVREHLLQCPDCRQEFEVIRVGVRASQELPAYPAPEGLWEKLEEALDSSPSADQWWIPQRVGSWPLWAVAAAVMFLVLSSSLLLLTLSSGDGQMVFSMEGTPLLNGKPVSGSARLAVGQQLSTDPASRARIELDRVGEVIVYPSSRIRLLESRPAKQLLALDVGTIQAQISAPPRLFFVETPGALAVDLGCTYQLDVTERGDGLLQVDLGWVGLVRQEREVRVPEGASCRISRERGPGFPYLETASPRFLETLARLESESPSPASIQLLLDEARPQDGLSLWYLLRESPSETRSLLLQGLQQLAPAPDSVDRRELEEFDAEALLSWRDHLEKLVWDDAK